MLQKSQTVLIAGGTGLIGQKLVGLLKKAGYFIVILSRKQRADENDVRYILWDPTRLYIDPSCPKADVLINLAGEGIAEKRWTKQRKQALLDSRVQSAKTIEKWLSNVDFRPRVYIGASAVGIYGDRGEEILTESSMPGLEFMSEICQQWEEAHREVLHRVERQVIIRIGIVLSKKGGALPKTLMTKGIGVLPVFGNGKQFYPWIHEDDLSSIFIQSIEDNRYAGIINGVAPEEIRVKDTMKILQKMLQGIWGLTPIPAWALRFGLGEMSKVILNSNRVVPEKLLQYDFKFKYKSFQEGAHQILKGNL